MPVKKPIEAIALLYPSLLQTVKESYGNLNEFCKLHDAQITEVVNLQNEFDYYGMRRLFQVLKYYVKPISIVASRNSLNLAPSLILWSAFEAMQMPEFIKPNLDFMDNFKKTLSNNTAPAKEEFYLICSKEVEILANWLSDTYFKIRYDNKDV